MKLYKRSILIPLILITNITIAQEHRHQGHAMHHSTPDTLQQMKTASMQESHKNLLYSRIGSGTGWLPDAAPKFGYMKHTDNWMYMIHGNIYTIYNMQDVGNEGTRGDEQLYSTNWIMGMGQTQVGKNGMFRFSTMVSFEPLTIGGAGYPLLFQSGETWEGVPLVDHQHPHDLFSELSVMYSHKLTEDISGFVYLAYPGEPALGPVAFMHRPSGIVISNTPLGHHWQDATHVIWGVGTLGFTLGDLKVESSIFTGTEPDEDRYNFDEPRFNSYSLRLSYNLLSNWAFQISRGWMYDVHALGPREDKTRTTASVIHAARLTPDIFLNTSAVWGYNETIGGHHPASHSFLVETSLTKNETTVYGRYEFVEKSTEDLLLNEAIYGHGNLYPVNDFTLGIQQKLFNVWNTNVSLGTQASLYITPEGLEEVYGENPWGVQFYLRIYPGKL